jgi:type II secretory pathway predicted ATPase ExeA
MVVNKIAIDPGSSDYGHILPACRAKAAQPDTARIAWIRSDRWIATARAEEALSRLEDLLSYPPRDRMPCLLIYGDTGMGKTKILRKFLRDHPPRFNGETGATSAPIAAMQMPPEPLESDFYSELLSALQAPAPIDARTHRLKETCRALLKSLGVRMLVIDEVHALLAGTFRQQRIFLNALRFLANDLRAPLVCAGTDLACQALLTDPQLAERFEAFHLDRWKNDRRLAELLISLAGVLPLRRPSALHTAEVRRRVLELTDGVTVRIFRLVESAAIEAIRSGEERITAQSFLAPDLAPPLVAMSRSMDARLARAAAR